MRDEQYSHLLSQALDRAQQFGFGLGVERAHGLIHEQERRVCQQRARDAETLSLPAGEFDALVADDRIEAIRQASMKSSAWARRAAVLISASTRAGLTSVKLSRIDA